MAEVCTVQRGAEKQKSHRSAAKFWRAVLPLKLVKASGRDHSVRSFLGLDAEEWGVLAVSACSFRPLGLGDFIRG